MHATCSPLGLAGAVSITAVWVTALLLPSTVVLGTRTVRCRAVLNWRSKPPTRRSQTYVSVLWSCLPETQQDLVPGPQDVYEPLATAA